MPNNQKNDNALPAGEKDPQLKSADDLAIDALSQDTEQEEGVAVEVEAKRSDDFAETLHALEDVIESKASKLMRLKQRMKKKRRMIKDVFENDEQLQQVEEEREEIRNQWKERKNDLNETAQVTEFKNDLKEARKEQRDLEESLSNHLINYHQLTNSTSFDTSDGDQWEFKIKAKVKTKKVETEAQ